MRAPSPVHVVALFTAALTLAACGDAGETVTATTEPDPGQRYRATATVLESPDHGPQLCLGGVAESYPPQCGGTDVVGWDWDAVEGAESASGTTWGTWEVVGTFDGERFTLTQPPGEPRWDDADAVGAPDFTTPCDEPDDGWAVVDPTTATEEARQAAIEYAGTRPDHAGTWLDQRTDPDDELDVDAELRTGDPARAVLNVRFTGDLDAHEAELRRRWGGPLCVLGAERTLAELETIRDELQAELDPLVSGVSEVANRVELQLVVAGDALHAELDERYGKGVVAVHGRLEPVD
jgi:hypothetical protein